ncbi:MAG: phosphatidylethanolamine N-methyltransferase [Magnetococcales bacterium]|nr:phosphatidylethanolamine N-methyltransferase [Magnetococcales bacterium]MBF0438338.1 phosphatidylethanolamine N-methyltransferase [Magnetococcales bacterium]
MLQTKTIKGRPLRKNDPSFRLLKMATRRLRYLWQKACVIGSITDSSRHLARCMVQQIDFSVPGLIVELGPGKGAVTQCLLKATPDPKRLLLVELLGEFIPMLKKKFPRIRVIHDSAERLPHHVRGRPVAAVVSGLPLRSLPTGMVERIGRALGLVMNANTRYIQFTYDLRTSDTPYFHNIGLRKLTSQIVLRNLPPARVDTFVTS